MRAQSRLVAKEVALSDVELASAIAAGDHDAFRALMRRHNRVLYRTARSIVRNDADAEDAVQNAYLLAHRMMGQFRGEAKLSTWLVRIVVNEALQCLRKRSRMAGVVSLDTWTLDDAVEADAGLMRNRPDGPEEALIRAQTRRLLESKIDELPLTYRAVIVRRLVEGCSVAETAVALCITEATVRTRAFRAKALLRDMLFEEFKWRHQRARGKCGSGLRPAIKDQGGRVDRREIDDAGNPWAEAGGRFTQRDLVEAARGAAS